ncbi:MAG: hypothetical protein SVW57_13205 [Thermodesulfobacteriota bacterium]|nr:hypothetical protein [Thermodesulfobacteriota bacterium]
MIRNDRLQNELKKFSPNAFAYAYEGEITGVIIIDENDKSLGYIIATESDKDPEDTTVIY